MSDIAFEPNYTLSAKSEGPLADGEPQTELGALDMDALDEVNGGLIPLLVGAAYVGLVGYSIYKYATR